MDPVSEISRDRELRTVEKFSSSSDSQPDLETNCFGSPSKITTALPKAPFLFIIMPGKHPVLFLTHPSDNSVTESKPLFLALCVYYL